MYNWERTLISMFEKSWFDRNILLGFGEIGEAMINVLHICAVCLSGLRIREAMIDVLHICAVCLSGFGETEEVKCGYDGCDAGKPGLEACWPIPIPEHDPDFRYNRCLKFVRSQGTPPLKCNFGEQSCFKHVHYENLVGQSEGHPRKMLP